MNVILICESAQLTGGAERVAILQALELRKRGFRVGYIAADPQKGADPLLIEAGVELCLLDAKSVFEETDNLRRLQLLGSNPFIRHQVKDFLATFDPKDTIVHAHSYRLRLSGSVLNEAQNRGFKTVIHCHEYATICPTALMFNHRTQQNCDLTPLSLACITCECQNESWKYKLPKIISARANRDKLKIYERANLFLAVSAMSRDVLTSHLPSSVQIEVIPNPHADLEPIEPPSETLFAYIGRLVPEKGPDQFLQAVSRTNARSVVIGAGPMEAQLKQAYPQASFTGWLNDEDLKTQMAKIWCLVVPSVWRETYGLSVIDALHQGIPVIVTNTVGTSVEVTESEAGIVLKDQQPETLIEAVQRMSDPLFHDECRQNALKWSKDNPRTVKEFVDSLQTHFERILA